MVMALRYHDIAISLDFSDMVANSLYTSMHTSLYMRARSRDVRARTLVCLLQLGQCPGAVNMTTYYT